MKTKRKVSALNATQNTVNSFFKGMKTLAVISFTCTTITFFGDMRSWNIADQRMIDNAIEDMQEANT